MVEKNKETIEIRQRCEEFFKKILDDAISHQRPNISQEAAFYLMSILILAIKLDPFKDNRLIGREYLESLDKNQPLAFKAIGDISLIIAGIWWQSLLRKLVDVDYYIKIGSKSYHKASESSSRKNLADLFEELAENFTDLINILSEATQCISESKMSNKDIMNMYDAWLKTHNKFLHERLISLGIIPVDIKTTKQ